MTTKGILEEGREIKAMNDAVWQVHRRTLNEWSAPRLRTPVTLGPDDSKRDSFLNLVHLVLHNFLFS